MIYELKDTTKAEALFDGIEDSMVQTCLQGLMGGKVYVTDPENPKSALAFCACFSWYAGEADRELAAFKPKGVVGMIPPDEGWAKLIEESWPDADKVTRYAIKKDTKFDRKNLEQLVAALPEGYTLRRIDDAIYDQLLEDDQFEDCVAHFESKEQFFEMGRGYAVLKDGKPVSVASSYSVYRDGIEIEIDTSEEERNKGLASAAGAKLILSCLDDGLYPSWDAANRISVHLAEKLGYEFSHEYPCCWLDEIIDRAIPNPDKSGWDGLCGVYESESSDHKRFTVLRKNGDLYANFVSTSGKPLEMKLFPLGENTFGLMWGDDEIRFSGSVMIVNGRRCWKLQESVKENTDMDKNTWMGNLAREAFEKGAFNGTWLLAEHGEIVSRGAVGWMDPENKRPMQEDALFDLASVSKQFTAAAIMLLRRKGLLDLEDELTKFFPELPYKGITIRHLLTHTSGLPDYMKWVDQIARAEDTIPGNEVVIRFLKEAGEQPRFQPGEKFEYCNTGYCVLAQIVELLSGVKFEDFMRENIFEPAGMHATRVRHPRKDGGFENWARAVVLEEGKSVLPEDSKRDNYVTTLDGEAGDGYVYSNIFDLFRWDQVLKEGTLLTKEEQELMYTPGAKVSEEGGDEVGYGFGWFIINNPNLGKVLSHSGGWPGVSTWFGRYLDADRVLILLCCRDVDERGDASFMRAMSAVARGEEPKPLQCIEDLEVKDPDKSRWASFCGNYETDPGEDSIEEVFLKDGELWAKVVSELGMRYPLKLYPIGENKFGIKEDDIEILFEDGCMVIEDETIKKL